jgi:cobalt-zinc-cadmium resistance protein CzcA
VPLRAVASITVDSGPAQISREGGHRKLTVEANVRDRDVAGFVAEARRRVERDVRLPAGYEARWGGQFENLEQATGRLAVVVPIALLLIFVLLHTAFGSARLAALVFANVPFAVSGGVFALAVRGLPFSISAGVGFIALFGIAVMNGVVLVSAARRLQLEGHTAAISACRGAELRLRPVLMTALVAALGFVPMALATSAGSEVQRPLATVVIGGLLTSTMLTLFVLPALYAGLMDGERVEPNEKDVRASGAQSGA